MLLSVHFKHILFTWMLWIFSFAKTIQLRSWFWVLFNLNSSLFSYTTYVDLHSPLLEKKRYFPSLRSFCCCDKNSFMWECLLISLLCTFIYKLLFFFFLIQNWSTKISCHSLNWFIVSQVFCVVSILEKTFILWVQLQNWLHKDFKQSQRVENLEQEHL